jgi:hypothetical protein
MATNRAKLIVAFVAFLVSIPCVVVAQDRTDDDEFGPVVRAYLGYLRDEQEVVDDRVSRREVSASYYRRNSNRIKALRQMALRLARDSQNDYLPELEAVASDEFKILFEKPPQLSTLRVGEVLRKTFRFLGSVRSGEVFYIFARLDPYEQAELQAGPKSEEPTESSDGGDKTLSRTRRVVPQPTPNP